MAIVRTYAHPLRKLKSGCRDQMVEISTITIYNIEYKFLKAKLRIREKIPIDPMHKKIRRRLAEALCFDRHAQII